MAEPNDSTLQHRSRTSAQATDSATEQRTDSATASMTGASDRASVRARHCDRAGTWPTGTGCVRRCDRAAGGHSRASTGEEGTTAPVAAAGQCCPVKRPGGGPLRSAVRSNLAPNKSELKKSAVKIGSYADSLSCSYRPNLPIRMSFKPSRIVSELSASVLSSVWATALHWRGCLGPIHVSGGIPVSPGSIAGH